MKLSAFVVCIGFLTTAHVNFGSPKRRVCQRPMPLKIFQKSYCRSGNGKYGLTLPLYTVPTPGDLEYKVQLTYTAGIKTEQLASEVGLGWNINSPSFSRSVNGMPDDVLNTQEDNYHYWKKLPAVYPAISSKNKKKIYSSQKSKRNEK